LAYDSLTPILAYSAIGGVDSTMMESAYDEGYGKYSFIGINPLATLRSIGCNVNIEYAGEVYRHQCDPYTLLPEFTKGRKVFGFDSFEGLPENWEGTVCDKGMFTTQGEIPVIEGVKFYKGWFEKLAYKYIQLLQVNPIT
jgi:anthranilate/para-aminobenzoate synthase component I